MDSNKTYSLKNFDKICRVCMQDYKGKKNHFKKLLANKKICEQFYEVFGQTLSADHNLPSTICSHCDKLLPDYLKFHIMCVSSYSQLREIKQQCIKEEFVEDAKDEELQIIQEMPIYVELLKNEDPADEVKHLKEETINDGYGGPNCSPKPQEDSSDAQEEGSKAKAKKPEVEAVVAEPPVKKAKRPRKPQQCPVCGTVVQRLEMHMRIHNDDQKLICDYCEKKFTCKSNLLCHFATHVDMPKIFKCHICPKAFAKAPEFRMHLIMHSGSRNYKCDQCDMAFNRAYTLRTHKLHIHIKAAKYLCELCDQKYYSKYHLKQHYKGKHWREHGEVFNCSYCGLRLKNKRTLDIHTRTHTKCSEFVCDICGKVLATRNGLQGHKKCHSNPKGRGHLTAMKEMRMKLATA